MGIGESDRPFCEAVELGSDHPGVIIEWGNIIVEVIDRDEQNIGFVLCMGRETRKPKATENGQGEQQTFHFVNPLLIRFGNW